MWLYSHRDKDNSIHYVAMNGRTGEINGSVPMNSFLYYFLFLLSLITLIVVPVFFFDVFIFSHLGFYTGMLLIIFSCISFYINVSVFYDLGYKYRNLTSRHAYEKETKAKISNIERKEEHLKTFTTSNEKMKVTNIDKIEGDYIVKDDEI